MGTERNTLARARRSHEKRLEDCFARHMLWNPKVTNVEYGPARYVDDIRLGDGRVFRIETHVSKALKDIL